MNNNISNRLARISDEFHLAVYDGRYGDFTKLSDKIYEAKLRQHLDNVPSYWSYLKTLKNPFTAYARRERDIKRCIVAEDLCLNIDNLLRWEELREEFFDAVYDNPEYQDLAIQLAEERAERFGLVLDEDLLRQALPSIEDQKNVAIAFATRGAVNMASLCGPK